MKIVVCVKQVPSSNEVKLDPKTNTIIREADKSVINPYDKFAIEEALKIKDNLKGEVIALSMGIPATEKILRDAMSRGCDRSVLLSDKKFAGADTLATAYTLSLGIKKIKNVSLIICGKMAIDGDTAQIGPELAETLKIPHITDVSEIIKISENEITCRKINDNGYSIIKMVLPAVITVVKDINLPRLPTIPGVLKSIHASFEIINAHNATANINRIGSTGSPTQVIDTFIPERKNVAIEIEGDIDKKIDFIGDIIKEIMYNGRIDN
ncbi:MAG: electron transfer flavoprotein subunit beta/FixA family protein [Tissierellales bacterium]|nr:electron transfer flavoprotein subunit beta/FixA family protein [Tissierellales bacterium]MBN2827007.1 electron transfer flavoprotein subunit beta/FixA family protein [Tissierellales bacterium]